MRVNKSAACAFEPATNTLWVDSSGVVYYMHYTESPIGRYQMTRLDNGKCRSIGSDKTALVVGLCLCTCKVTLTNECVSEVRDET